MKTSVMGKLQTKTSELHGEIFAALSAVGVAGYLVTNRYIYTRFSPPALDYTSTFVMISGGFALLTLLLQKAYRRKKPTKITQFLLLLTIGIVAGIGIGLVVVGQKYSSAANVAIVSSITIPSTLLFSRLILKQTIQKSRLPWIILMFIGIYLAIIGLHPFHIHRGDILVMVACILYGLVNTISQVALKGNSPSIVRDVRFVTSGTIYALLILLHPGVSFVQGIGVYPYISALFFWTSVFFFISAVKRIGPSHSIVINNGQTVITMLAAVPLLGEHLTLIKLVGAAAVLFAIQKISSKK